MMEDMIHRQETIARGFLLGEVVVYILWLLKRYE
jgi:hypothetical protein